MSKKSTNSFATEPITKARTIEEMAEIYHFSVETFRAQIEGYEPLWNQLKKSNFMGKVFFPKQQQTVFRYLGDIEKPVKFDDSFQKENVKRDRIIRPERNQRFKF